MLGAYYLDLTYGKRRSGFSCSSTQSFFCSPFLGTRCHGASARGAFGGAFGIGELLDPDTTVTNKALFGSLSYDITEQLTLNVEVLAARRFTSSFATGAIGFTMALPDPRQVGVTLQANFGET